MNPTPFDRPGTQPSPLFTPGTERAGVSRVVGASASVRDLFIVTARMSDLGLFSPASSYSVHLRAGPRKGTGLRLAIFRYLHKISRFVP